MKRNCRPQAVLEALMVSGLVSAVTLAACVGSLGVSIGSLTMVFPVCRLGGTGVYAIVSAIWREE
jgi:hypothetical protein